MKERFTRLCRILWSGVSWYLKTHKCALAEFGKGCWKNFVATFQFKGLLSQWNNPKSATNSNGVESEWGGAKRFKRLEKTFKGLMTEVYLYFFSGVLPSFKETNLVLQREDPSIHLVHSQLNKLLLQLAGKLMPVTEIKNAPQVSDINIDNHKPQEELFVGICTKNLLNKLFEDGEISALDKQKFFAGVLAFYSELFSYGVEKLLINNSVLKYSIFAHMQKGSQCQ